MPEPIILRPATEVGVVPAARYRAGIRSVAGWALVVLAAAASVLAMAALVWGEATPVQRGIAVALAFGAWAYLADAASETIERDGAVVRVRSFLSRERTIDLTEAEGFQVRRGRLIEDAARPAVWWRPPNEGWKRAWLSACWRTEELRDFFAPLG